MVVRLKAALAPVAGEAVVGGFKVVLQPLSLMPSKDLTTLRHIRIGGLCFAGRVLSVDGVGLLGLQLTAAPSGAAGATTQVLPR
jgi:hypothetical protein